MPKSLITIMNMEGSGQNGKEYTFKVGSENKLPTVWSHVIANENFGTVVTDNLRRFHLE